MAQKKLTQRPITTKQPMAPLPRPTMENPMARSGGTLVPLGKRK